MLPYWGQSAPYILQLEAHVDTCDQTQMIIKNSDVYYLLCFVALCYTFFPPQKVITSL